MFVGVERLRDDGRPQRGERAAKQQHHECTEDGEPQGDADKPEHGQRGREDENSAGPEAVGNPPEERGCNRLTEMPHGQQGAAAHHRDRQR